MLLRRAVFIGLLAAIVLLTVLMVLLSRSPAPQHTAPQPAPQQTVPAPPQTPPVCTYSYKVEFCDEAGCTLSLTVEAEKTVEVKIDGYAWKVARGTRQVQVPWNSTLRVESPCFSLEYTPQLYYTASARVLEYDVETGQKRVEVTLEFSLPYRGDVVVGGQRLYAYGKRLTAIVTTYDGVPVKIGPFASVLPMPEPQLSLNVTAYSTCDRYVYVVSYNLTNAESARWRYYTLRRGQLEITSAEKLDKLCLGPHCAPVVWARPRVDVEVSLYYVYNFPLAIVRIKNGPTCWEGVVNFTAVRPYVERYNAVCVNTAYGQACLPSEALGEVLRGIERRDVPFSLTLRPRQSYAFAYTPLAGALRIGNITITLPPPPEISLMDVKCGVRRVDRKLRDLEYAYAPLNAEADVVREYLCNATLAVRTRGYVVVNPVIAVRGGNLTLFYAPPVATSQDVAVTITLAFPLELRVYGRELIQLGYRCTIPINGTMGIGNVYLCRYEGEVEIAVVR